MNTTDTTGTETGGTGLVRVTVPAVPGGADLYRSWRRLVTGLDEHETGEDAVLGREAGHGAVVETLPQALLLVVDQHVTGWDHHYVTGERYPQLDAVLTLHFVQDDGTLKKLWNRHFKTAKGAFGSAGLGQIRKHLAVRPQPSEVPLVVVDPGPGVPNLKPGVCRWCAEPLAKGAGVLAGRGRDAQVEHRRECPWTLAEAGSVCALCERPVAPRTARVVVVREGAGRREVRHQGPCDGQLSPEEYERRAAEQRADLDRLEELRRAEEAKAARRKAAAAERRRAAKEEKEKAAKALAEATKERVARLDVVEAPRSRDLYDKKLSPSGERMRLTETRVRLSDGEEAVWWDVVTYGGYAGEGDDDRGGRYYRLDDARWTYQQYSYQEEPYQRRPRERVGAVRCPEDGARHCDNCGTTVSVGGWMSASLGLACDTDCYTAMSDAPGAHAARYHR